VDDLDNKSVKSTSISVGKAHVLQFCHLCYRKKVAPVSYSADTMPAIEQWYNSIAFICLQPAHSNRPKRQAQHNELDSDQDEDISSPDQKLSKKIIIF